MVITCLLLPLLNLMAWGDLRCLVCVVGDATQARTHPLSVLLLQRRMRLIHCHSLLRTVMFLIDLVCDVLNAASGLSVARRLVQVEREGGIRAIASLPSLLGIREAYI